MDRLFHQLAVLSASICLVIVAFSVLFSTGKSSQFADIPSSSAELIVELSQSQSPE